LPEDEQANIMQQFRALLAVAKARNRDSPGR
jgi:hypothetical protein